MAREPKDAPSFGARLCPNCSSGSRLKSAFFRVQQVSTDDVYDEVDEDAVSLLKERYIASR